MKRSYRLYRIVGDMLILILFSTVLVACGGGGIVRPAKLYQEMEGKTVKSAYIVTDKLSSEKIKLTIHKMLTESGILSSYGPLKDKPDTVDVYVSPYDYWSWDVVSYLQSLDIKFYENTSGSLWAAGKYEILGFHGYPDPEKITKDVVQSILTKMNFKNLSSSTQQ
jgi:hypothetical protein